MLGGAGAVCGGGAAITSACTAWRPIRVVTRLILREDPQAAPWLQTVSSLLLALSLLLASHLLPAQRLCAAGRSHTYACAASSAGCQKVAWYGGGGFPHLLHRPSQKSESYADEREAMQRRD